MGGTCSISTINLSSCHFHMHYCMTTKFNQLWLRTSKKFKSFIRLWQATTKMKTDTSCWWLELQCNSNAIITPLNRSVNLRGCTVADQSSFQSVPWCGFWVCLKDVETPSKESIHWFPPPYNNDTKRATEFISEDNSLFQHAAFFLSLTLWSSEMSTMVELWSKGVICYPSFLLLLIVSSAFFEGW